MNKQNDWYQSLPKHTQEYLKTAAIWTDRDMLIWMSVSFIAGLIIGVIL
ncbi:hypothetical protein UFOVP112_320 [uncultured Caudovirales phage]|uniref:Uncharacterized protein n=1 Tax=uncultured Caudovirales phage TaxID=2100421 RepID=A0A6J5L6T9_9CAUD|nr:hypothetical protein UFOVP112_320 [uncultured Caudovirales phage]